MLGANTSWPPHLEWLACKTVLSDRETSKEEEGKPVMVYLDRYRGSLLAAAHSEHARQVWRVERARSGWVRMAAARWALLASLVEAIGGEV